jgi:phytoene/squalene synthetase
MTALAACIARVEAGDPDRFAAVMASPAPLRARLWPLYAANLEIARAPWASNEPLIAEMRLQWWVDAMEALAVRGTTPRHEIGAALEAVRPVARQLAGIAEARRRDCWRMDWADTAEFWEYLDQTSGALYEATGDLLGCPHPALREFGRAAGLAAWFLAVPELSRRGLTPLPAGAEPGDLAREGLRALRAAYGKMPRSSRVAALGGWEAQAILQAAERAPALISGEALRGSEFSRRLWLLRRAFGF